VSNRAEYDLAVEATERRRLKQATVAAVALAVVDASLAPARRQRRREVRSLIATAAAGTAVTIAGWLTATAPVAAAGAVAAAAAAAVAYKVSPRWTDIRTEGNAQLFHALSTANYETVTEQLSEELAQLAQAGGVASTMRLAQVPHPTVDATNAYTAEIDAVDLYWLSNNVASTDQLAGAARRWLDRTVPGCAEAAEALALTGRYQTMTIGETASAAARTMRETPPVAPTGPGARRPTRFTWSALGPVVVGAIALAGITTSAGALQATAAGFGPKMHTTIEGRIDIGGAAAIGTWLDGTATGHRFLLDDDGKVFVVDSDADVVETGSDNRPLDSAVAGVLVTVAVDPNRIPAGRTTVYLDNSGNWTTDRSWARYSQDRPFEALGVALITTGTISLVLFVAAVFDKLTDSAYRRSRDRRSTGRRRL
jgi:hypothetical protein